MKFKQSLVLLLLLVPVLAFAEHDGGSSGGGHDGDPAMTEVERCIYDVYVNIEEYAPAPTGIHSRSNPGMVRALTNICRISAPLAYCIDDMHWHHPDQSIREVHTFCERSVYPEEARNY